MANYDPWSGTVYGLPMNVQMGQAAGPGMAAPPTPADPEAGEDMAAPALPQRAPMPSLSMDPTALLGAPLTPDAALAGGPPAPGSPAGPAFEVPRPFSRKRYGGIFDDYFRVRQGGMPGATEPDPAAGQAAGPGAAMLVAGQGMGGGPVAGGQPPPAPNLPGGAPANPYAPQQPAGNPVLQRYPRLNRMVRRVYRYDPAADPTRQGV